MYYGIPDTCQFADLGAEAIGAQLSGYVEVNPTEAALKDAVDSIGPISVGIYATKNFMSYSSG